MEFESETCGLEGSGKGFIPVPCAFSAGMIPPATSPMPTRVVACSVHNSHIRLSRVKNFQK